MKFISDTMLNDLCKNLRILGIDTLFFAKGDDFLLIKKALKENRFILTKDTQIKNIKSAKNLTILIKSDNTKEQIKQIIDETKLKILKKNFLIRCLNCNSLLKKIEKVKIKNRVPEYVYKKHRRFTICENCKKIYWQGTHFKNIEKKLANIV